MVNPHKVTEIQSSLSAWEGLEVYSILPDWVLTAIDPVHVSQALNANLPEFLSGIKVLHGCDIHTVRYKDGKWSGTYQLEIEDRSDGVNPSGIVLQGTFLSPEQVLGRTKQIIGKLGEDSWYALLPEVNLEFRSQAPEKVLAALSSLTDPEVSRQLLESSIRTGSKHYANLHIQGCTPKVVRYKPGSRCTVVYHLDYDQENSGASSWPRLVVAKTYRNEKGLNAWESMRAVWESPLGRSNVVTIAEPLAYLPDMRVLVQGPISEQQTLKELIRSAVIKSTPEAIDEMLSFMRKTVAGVIALHTSGVKFGPTWTWDNELATVQEQVDNLAMTIPEIKTGTEPLLSQLWKLAHNILPDLNVPSHGSFRPAQVLINEEKIGFIDFDSFCQSEPSLDLALFLGNVKSIGLTAAEEDEEAPFLDDAEKERRLQILENACNIFLDDYESALPVSRQRISLWETLDLLTIVIHSWTKVKPVRLNNTLYLLKRNLCQSGLIE